MSEKTPKGPWSPDTYLNFGVLGVFIGGLVLGLTYDVAPAIGFIMLGVAGLILQIGIIAKGVEVGMKSAWPVEE